MTVVSRLCSTSSRATIPALLSVSAPMRNTTSSNTSSHFSQPAPSGASGRHTGAAGIEQQAASLSPSPRLSLTRSLGLNPSHQGEVAVGVLPQRQKVVVRRFGLARLAVHLASPRYLKVDQRP